MTSGPGPFYFAECGTIASYTTNELEPNNVVYKEKPKFESYKKIPRLFRDMIITEKIDGTNASIWITEDGDIYAAKRSGFITPEKDNFGFAAWVESNKQELLKLGKGRHFGEWYGKGINRGYGLSDKRFALFNASIDSNTVPSCCGIVPVLWHGIFDTSVVRDCLARLKESGSVLVPGFLNPEGVVVYHEKAGQMFKVTIENDEVPKGVTSV